MRTLTPPTVAPVWLRVVRKTTGFEHLTAESLRAEAAEAVAKAFEGVSGTNPLYRIALMFVVMRRLGVGRDRALWLLEWARRLVDALWPEEDAPSLEEALEQDADLDVRDDMERMRALRRDPEAMQRYLDARMEQVAYAPTVIQALRREIAAAQVG